MRRHLIVTVFLLILSLIFSGCTTEAIKQENKKTTEVKSSKKVYLYFSDNDLLTIYRIEKLIEYSKEEDLPKLALSEWLNGPGANFEELGSTVPSDVTVEYMNFKDDIAYVSFSKELKNANLGSSGEAALLEQIAMILQQFGYNETQILVEGEVLDTLLGHMDTSKPIKANKPEDYTLLKDN